MMVMMHDDVSEMGVVALLGKGKGKDKGKGHTEQHRDKDKHKTLDERV